MKQIFKNSRRGFTIFFAMLVSSLALAIGLAIFDITLRELDLSSTATQSQYAIYSADTGAECALYWDAKYGGSGSVFATSTNSTPPSSGVSCAGVDIAAQPWTITKITAAATTTFTLQFSPQTYCAVVTVAKNGASGQLQTSIISRGYNTCAAPGAARIERTLQVNY